MKHMKPVNTTTKEIDAAYEDFVVAVQKHKQLGLLFLIDPIHAFSDAGIEMSKAARKIFRRNFPRDVTKTKSLYNAAKKQENTRYLKCVEMALVKRRD